MKYIIPVLCILLIIVSFIVVIREIRMQLKGKCCKSCRGCKQKCSKNQIK